MKTAKCNKKSKTNSITKTDITQKASSTCTYDDMPNRTRVWTTVEYTQDWRLSAPTLTVRMQKS